jgi:hypothetical protein
MKPNLLFFATSLSTSGYLTDGLILVPRESFLFFAVLEFELRAYTLSHSTSPFL